MDYAQNVLSNLGPLAAGALTVVVPIYVPLPSIALNVIGRAPPAVWSALAGWAVTPPGEDQLSYALKGVAGGVGTAFILRQTGAL
ncbi:MAG: hypothetical protein ACO32I_08130 [Candidatus Limnocylindrus sp.]